MDSSSTSRIHVYTLGCRSKTLKTFVCLLLRDQPIDHLWGVRGSGGKCKKKYGRSNRAYHNEENAVTGQQKEIF